MAFELVKLNYAYDALEPVIDKETMEIHHSKHHQAYVNNLNNLIKDTIFEEASLEEILTHLDHAPEDKKAGITNNVGGVFNHNLFWESMTPGGAKEPVGEVAKKITEKYGDFEAFKEEFNKKGAGQFGSGWVWLVSDKEGNIDVVATPNQNCPISCGKVVLLGNDVWEHAYYLKYQNRRADYLKEWWKVVNWDVVEARYQKRNPESCGCCCGCGC